MALITRYSADQRGAIVITGNTLGLSRLTGTQDPGLDHAINQFITTNTALPVPPRWSAIVNLNQNANITFDWQQNSSSAILTMLAPYTVQYAELIWGGLSVSASSSGAPVDVSQFIDNPVTFTTPRQVYTISPDPATAQTAVTSSGTFYSRTQNVTSIVAAAGNGQYTVGGVASAINLREASTINHAGWSLIVAYTNTSLPPRNMTIYVGEELVGSGNVTNVNVTGFMTPVSGAISARITASAQEGDAVLTGDQMLFGQNAASLQPLSGPNNPSNNFFGSQINIGDPNNQNVGTIDVSGTFGWRNSDVITARNISAGRQGWDITNVSGSNNLVNNQTSALIRLTSSGDVYVLNGLGIQIDTILVTAVKSVDLTIANLGDTLTYTVQLNNQSGTPQTVTFRDPIPAGTTYVAQSLAVSKSYTGNLTSGIVTTIQPGETVGIQWKVAVGTAIPNPNPISNTGVLSISGLPDKNTNTVSTVVQTADKSITKTPAPSPFVPGQTAQYTVTVSNRGPYPAQNVFVQDNIPSSIVNPEFSQDQGKTWNPWQGVLGLGTVGVNSTITFLIRGTMLSRQTDPVTNTATVTSTTPDPNINNDRVTITTQVQPSADVSVVKSGPANIIAGNQIQYTATVRNAGPSAAQRVVLSDNFDTADFTNVEYSINNGLTWSAWTSPLELDTLTAGAVRTVAFRANVSHGSVQSITNTATVTASTQDPNPDNNTSTVNTTITTRADISVVKTQSANTPPINADLVYTLVISNIGPSDSRGVVLTDVLPAELVNQEYSTVSDAGPWTAWPADGIYPIGTLVHDEIVTIYLKGTTTTTDDIVNTARVSAQTTDPNPDNNTSTISTNLQNAVLVVRKGLIPQEVIAGQMITYTIDVANTSVTTPAYDVTLEDKIPSIIEEAEYSLNGGTTWFIWDTVLNIGTVDPDSTRQVLIRGTLSPSASGNITNQVTVTSTNANSDTDSFITAAGSEADIYVTKTGTPEPIVAGQNIQYSMLVGNNGPSNAQTVQLVDQLPDEFLNPTVSVDYEIFSAITFPYEIPLGTIVAGQMPVSVRLRGVLSTGTVGNLTNTVNVSSTTYDPDLENNEAAFTSTVSANADLKVLKEISQNPVVAGNELIYTLSVINDGISDAQMVTITDVVDPRLSDVRYSESQDGPWTDWNDTITFPSLAAESEITIYIKGVLDPSATGVINNTAEVSSETPDSNPQDNTITITTPIIQSADLALVKTSLNDAVTAGNQILFRETVTNNGPSDSIGVILNDPVPANIQSVEYSIDGGAVWQEWTSELLLGDIPANDSIEILIRGMVNETTNENIVNTARVIPETMDPDPSNNSSTAEVPITAVADLVVKKTGVQNPPRVGDYLTHSISYTNLGPSSAQQAVLTDITPPEMKNPEFSVDGGVTWNPWSGSISVPIVPSGIIDTVLIRGIIDSSAEGSQIMNTAIVGSNTPDPDPSNNTSIFITTPDSVNEADLSISKIGTPKQAVIGGMLKYKLTVTNAGPGDAADVVITDTQPSNLTLMQYTLDGGMTWETWNGSYSLGNLAANSSSSILLRGVVANYQTSYILNVATVTTTTRDTNLANNTAVLVTPIAASSLDFQICQSADCTHTSLYKPVNFKVTICNQSMMPLFNVQLCAQQSVNLSGVEYSIDSGCSWKRWNQSYQLDVMNAGCCREFMFRGIVVNSNEGYVTNKVQVYADKKTYRDWINEVKIPIYY